MVSILKRLSFLCMILSAILVTFCSCSILDSFIDTAQSNMETDKELPVYELNKKNFHEITYNKKTYEITEDTVNRKKLEVPIGKVTESVTFDQNHKILSKKELRKIHLLPAEKDEKRTHLNFGWIYSIKDKDSEKEIAVVVNEKYLKAVIKKKK